MESDDLNAPLGQTKKKSRFPKLPIGVPQILAGLLGTVALVVVGWTLFVSDPLGGEPVAVVATKPAAAVADVVAGAASGDGKAHARHDGATAHAAATEKAPPPGSKIVTIIDGSSGKRKEITLPGKSGDMPGDMSAAKSGEKPGGKSDDKPGDKSPGAAHEAPPVDPKLTESSRHGAIPKVGADGTKPFVAYAHPRALTTVQKGAPRIAIVIGGMGISASGTAEAFSKLPPTATFALSPYAADVKKLAERARDEGHELLLQTPMEPFDFPDNDPGPQTLLTSVTPEQNIDRLQWLMSRFQGYVGIVSYMGARFTATQQALSPVLQETAKRGLIFVDGGGSSRSIASQIAGSQNLPFAKADVVLDAVPTAAEIDRALNRLEIMARESGGAVGIATAQSATVARIADWAQKAEARGFVLVPISMVAVKAKSS